MACVFFGPCGLSCALTPFCHGAPLGQLPVRFGLSDRENFWDLLRVRAKLTCPNEQDDAWQDYRLGLCYAASTNARIVQRVLAARIPPGGGRCQGDSSTGLSYLFS